MSFVGLLTVYIVAAFTPGPNNAVALTLGARGGYRAASPFVWGATFGFPTLCLCGVGGLGALLLAAPSALDFLRYAAVLFLLFLAAKIAFAPTDESAARVAAPARRGRFGGFVGGFLFQFVNPKGVAFALSLVSAYIRPRAESFLLDVFTLAAVGFVVTFAAVSSWALFGAKISASLSTARRRRIFNFSCGFLFAASALLLL